MIFVVAIEFNKKKKLNDGILKNAVFYITNKSIFIILHYIITNNNP